MIPHRTIRRFLASCAAVAPLLTGLSAGAQDFGTSVFNDNNSIFDNSTSDLGTSGFGGNTSIFDTPPAPPVTGSSSTRDTVSIDPLGLGTIDANIPLILEADTVTYDTQGRVARAVGDAEAFYGDRVLGADSLIYDVGNNTVAAEGAVALRNNDGNFLFAEDATLATDLTDGTITQPRLVIEGGGKLAAVAGERVDDRYTVLSKAVYSACEVCADDPTPLWRVRANKVIHDEVTRDIIYQDATFDVEGVSVLYLPYFRHPDPTVERRSGFLTPSFSRNETIGFTLKTPYYFNLAPNRDLTITPYVTTRDGLLLEGEYRARTEDGQYRLFGTGTINDSLGQGSEFRGALNGEGLFRLDSLGADGWYAGFDVDLASDDTFLRRYEYTDNDRTTSRAFVGHQTDHIFTETNLIYFQSFRPDEDDDLIPQVLPEFRYSNRVVENPWAGTVIIEASAVRLERENGRDYNRIGTGAQWRRPIITEPGLLVTPFADFQADLYLIEDDPTFRENTEIRATGAVGIDLRYPLVAQNSLGTHVIEPIIQLIAAPNSTDSSSIPNEDSLDTEFDETSLFSFNSRFPGEDRFENGHRANIGVRYDFESESGFGIEAVYGRVIRLRDNDEFSSSSGLREEVSDHVGALRLTLPPYFDITHRFRLDGREREFQRQEIYARGQYGPVSGNFGYLFLEADPLAGFDEDREEIFADTAIKLSDNWTVYGSGRADLEDSRFVSSGGGLRYENECCTVDLSVNRRFNDDRDANDDTSVGLQVRLKSLGG